VIRALKDPAKFIRPLRGLFSIVIQLNLFVPGLESQAIDLDANPLCPKCIGRVAAT
jgi:hypothetical protein